MTGNAGTPFPNVRECGVHGVPGIPHGRAAAEVRPHIRIAIGPVVDHGHVHVQRAGGSETRPYMWTRHHSTPRRARGSVPLRSDRNPLRCRSVTSSTSVLQARHAIAPTNTPQRQPPRALVTRNPYPATCQLRRRGGRRLRCPWCPRNPPGRADAEVRPYIRIAIGPVDDHGHVHVQRAGGSETRPYIWTRHHSTPRRARGSVPLRVDCHSCRSLSLPCSRPACGRV